MATLPTHQDIDLEAAEDVGRSEGPQMRSAPSESPGSEDLEAVSHSEGAI